ncbi:RNA polymerase [Catenaria anguillulae PL171]|uniref:DNA-directed RNA polymerases I, II, and III subunit RPABC3 n=1 Tax=Catenaria anguillulae PL171 TaxID=765915 RepID=A0A1Y2HSI5_9FUNG|nr:RNA polymerase [Catenaria anguillulae PL171]
MSDIILFSDLFTISAVDADGKRFDRVSRLKATSDNYNADVTLDFNNELYPLKTGEKFTLTLATPAALGPQRDSWRQKLPTDEKDLSDEYEYVCNGRCYKFEEEGDNLVTVYISFGGMLLGLKSKPQDLNQFKKGEHVVLLMRK